MGVTEPYRILITGGGTTTAISALKGLRMGQDPSLHVVEGSHVEEYGPDRVAPEGAIVHFRSNDPQDGPMIRYSMIWRTELLGEDLTA